LQQTAVPNSAELTNSAVVPLTTVLPSDPLKASATDGASFYSTEFQRRVSGGKVRVRVTAYASSATPNEVVVAVFAAGQAKPIQLVAKPVSDERVTIDLDIELAPGDATQLQLDFRIGPAEPGTIIFNGPEGAEAAETTIRITEG